MRVPPNATWIGSDHPFDLQEAYLNFRRDIDHIAGRSAIMFISADSRYRLWINGEFVSRGPARSWPHAQQIDRLDITRHLQPGRNALAVQVYSPGYSHFSYLHRGACGLLAWLNLDDQTIAATDQSWRVLKDKSWSPLAHRVSIYGSGVELRDLRLCEDWQTADTGLARWKPPRIVAPAESNLWSGLQGRCTPILNESRVELKRAKFFRSGHCSGQTVDPHADLRSAWNCTAPAEQPAFPIQAHQDGCLIWVFDLGQSLIGHASFEIEGARGGERLLVSYAEKLENGDLLLPDSSTYCRMRPTDAFTLRPGKQASETFSFRGGRYLIFCLFAPEPVKLKLSFAFVQSSYPIDRIKRETLPEDMAAISAMCERTLLACLQDTFVDSVWRESSQWLGDCVTQAFALAGLSDDLRPLRTAITMAAQGAYKDSVLPSVLPGEVHAYTITDYNFSWIELLDFYCERADTTAGRAFLEAMWTVLVRLLDHFHGLSDGVGLISSEAGRRLFLDWSPVDRREPNLTYNARYLYALELAVQLGNICDRTEDSNRWLERARDLRNSIRKAFKPNSSWNENLHGTPATQLGLALATLTGSIETDKCHATLDDVVARSLDLEDRHLDGKLVLASPFMHHYVFKALEQAGRYGDILSIIRARWGRWAKSGEPTTWENWNIDFPDGSTCHGFSAHPLGWIWRCRQELSRE